MTVKLLTEQHFEFLSLEGGSKGWSEYILFKVPHCRKSHVTAHMSFKKVLKGQYYKKLHIKQFDAEKKHIQCILKSKVWI